MKGSIRKRPPSSDGRTRWELRVRTGERQLDGRYRQISRTFIGSEREAQKALRRLVVEAESGELASAETSSASASVAAMLRTYYNRKEANWSPRHRDANIRFIERLEALSWPTKTKPGDVTAPTIEAFYRYLVADEGWGPASVVGLHRLIRAAINDEVRLGVLDRNPAARAQTPKVPKRTSTVPSITEVARLIESVSTHNPPLALLIRTAVETTARRGELAALRWADFDASSQTITFSGAITRSRGENIRKSTKAEESRRVVPISAELAESLVEYRKTMTETHARCGQTVAPTTPIWTRGTTLNPIELGHISQAFRKEANRIGLSARFHDLRHSGITEMLAGGVDPVTAASISGHSTPTVLLNVYGHVVERRRRDATSVISSGLNAEASKSHPSSRPL